MTRFFDMVRAPPEDRMRRYTYRKMQPADISAALESTGLSVGQFSRIIGARYNGPDDSTVQKWLDGKQDAPTYLPALFALLVLPGGVQVAREAAERYIVEQPT
jgi:DNA-binding transcriptional regulator YiaG